MRIVAVIQDEGVVDRILRPLSRTGGDDPFEVAEGRAPLAAGPGWTGTPRLRLLGFARAAWRGGCARQRENSNSGRLRGAFPGAERPARLRRSSQQGCGQGPPARGRPHAGTKAPRRATPARHRPDRIAYPHLQARIAPPAPSRVMLGYV
jgi:hypothetical protein